VPNLYTYFFIRTADDETETTTEVYSGTNPFQSYVTIPEDDNKTLSVRVKAENTLGETLTDPYFIGPIRNTIPTIITPITYDGALEVGETITVYPFAYGGESPFTFTYQWRINGQDIDGETLSYYIIDDVADSGKELSVVVGCQDSSDPPDVATPVTQVIGTIEDKVPVFDDPAVTVEGTFAHGETITATVNVTGGDVPLSYTYTILNENGIELQGPNQSIVNTVSYEIQISDIGSTLSLKVEIEDASGSQVSQTEELGVVPDTIPSITNVLVTSDFIPGNDIDVELQTLNGEIPLTYNFTFYGISEADVETELLNISDSDFNTATLTTDNTLIGHQIKLVSSVEDVNGDIGNDTRILGTMQDDIPVIDSIIINGPFSQGGIIGILVSASGGDGELEYRYVITNQDGTELLNENYSSSNTTTYSIQDTDIGSTLTLLVEVRDLDGDVVSQETEMGTVADTIPEITNVETIGNFEPGETITSTLTVNGGEYPLEYDYKFYTQNIEGTQNILKQIFNSTSNYESLLLTNDEIGKEIRLESIVRDVNQSSNMDDRALGTIIDTAPEITDVAVSPTPPFSPGSRITVTLATDGGEVPLTYSYKFYTNAGENDAAGTLTAWGGNRWWDFTEVNGTGILEPVQGQQRGVLKMRGDRDGNPQPAYPSFEIGNIEDPSVNVAFMDQIKDIDPSDVKVIITINERTIQFSNPQLQGTANNPDLYIRFMTDDLGNCTDENIAPGGLYEFQVGQPYTVNIVVPPNILKHVQNSESATETLDITNNEIGKEIRLESTAIDVNQSSNTDDRALGTVTDEIPQIEGIDWSGSPVAGRTVRATPTIFGGDYPLQNVIYIFKINGETRATVTHQNVEEDDLSNEYADYTIPSDSVDGDELTVTVNVTDQDGDTAILSSEILVIQNSIPVINGISYTNTGNFIPGQEIIITSDISGGDDPITVEYQFINDSQDILQSWSSDNSYEIKISDLGKLISVLVRVSDENTDPISETFVLESVFTTVTLEVNPDIDQDSNADIYTDKVNVIIPGTESTSDDHKVKWKFKYKG